MCSIFFSKLSTCNTVSKLGIHWFHSNINDTKSLKSLHLKCNFELSMTISITYTHEMPVANYRNCYGYNKMILKVYTYFFL